jgi:hypothetical protein
MASQQPERRLQLVEIDEGVWAALRKMDEMSDAELRDLARGEAAMFVDAVEGVIARRHTNDQQ